MARKKPFLLLLIYCAFSLVALFYWYVPLFPWFSFNHFALGLIWYFFQLFICILSIFLLSVEAVKVLREWKRVREFGSEGDAK